MKNLIPILLFTLLFSACMTEHDPAPVLTPEPEYSEVASELSGTDPGVVACKSNGVEFTCSAPQFCSWSTGYGQIGGCTTTVSHSFHRCDGPEDCSSGETCCMNSRMTPYGTRFSGACQRDACASTGEEDIAIHVTLTHPGGACPAGQSAVRAGAVYSCPWCPTPGGCMWCVNQEGIPGNLWVCK